eukprot:1156183-Pelagomonas_calceolata.AAC.17
MTSRVKYSVMPSSFPDLHACTSSDYQVHPALLAPAQCARPGGAAPEVARGSGFLLGQAVVSGALSASRQRAVGLMSLS